MGDLSRHPTARQQAASGSEMSISTKPLPDWVDRVVLWMLYLVFAAVLISEPVGNPFAFVFGVAMIVLPVVWYFAGTERMTRVVRRLLRPVAGRIENAATAVVDGIGAIITTGIVIFLAALWIGIPLGALYFLVRFVKWAWSN